MKRHNRKFDGTANKAFLRLVIVSAATILACVICLCSTTFAWFSDNVPSVGNSIMAAEECLLTVTVTKDGGTVLDNIENGVELEAGVPYTVKLSLPSGSSSGYCMINAGGTEYYTDYIARHDDAEPQTVTFILTVGSTQVVTFRTHWGIYSRDSDVVNGEITIP